MRRAFILWCLWSASAQAASSVETVLARDPLTIDDLLEVADLASPGIAAAREDAAAAAGQASQAHAFANPSLELNADMMPADAPSLSNAERRVGMELPLPALSRRGDVAAADAVKDVRAQDFELARRAAHRRVRELASAVLRLRSGAAAYDSLLVRGRRVEEIARLRAEARAEPKAHAKKAAIEIASIEADRARVDAERRAAVARLAAALGTAVPVERLAEGPAPRVPELEALREEVRERHPRLLAARASLDAARATSRAAGVAWLPSPTLRAAWGIDAADEEFVEAGASLELPLFNRKRGGAAEARSLATRAERELQDAEATLDAEVVAAHARWTVARDRLVAQREIVEPAAEDAMSLSTEGYEAGRLPFLDLLDALRTLADAKRASLDSALEADETTAALLELAGPSSPDSPGEQP